MSRVGKTRATYSRRTRPGCCWSDASLATLKASVNDVLHSRRNLQLIGTKNESKRTTVEWKGKGSWNKVEKKKKKRRFFVCVLCVCSKSECCTRRRSVTPFPSLHLDDRAVVMDKVDNTRLAIAGSTLVSLLLGAYYIRQSIALTPFERHVLEERKYNI